MDLSKQEMQFFKQQTQEELCSLCRFQLVIPQKKGVKGINNSQREGGEIKLVHLGKTGKKTGTFRHFTLHDTKMGKILYFMGNYSIKVQ